VGASQELTARLRPNSPTEVEDATAFRHDAIAKLTYGPAPDGNLIAITAESSHAEVTFDESEITQPDAPVTVHNAGYYTASRADGSVFGVAAGARSIGWEYQSFGSWIIEGTSFAPRRVIVQSVGNETLNVPTSGLAVYSGRSAGVFHTGGSAALGIRGESYDTRASVQVDVDFAGGPSSLVYTMSATAVDDLSTEDVTFVARPGLNMRSVLDNASGSIDFIGRNVSTRGGMTGTVNGLFYGPRADEVGGTFSVNNRNTNSTYIGAFGARQ
jgi:hypothetical protein